MPRSQSTDLDNFKQVNDRLGHERGDEVLRAFAAVLASTPRASDVAARLGGDEFVLLMPHTRFDEALALVERIRSRFAADARVAQTGTTVSVGLLSEDPASSTIEELLIENYVTHDIATARPASSMR